MHPRCAGTFRPWLKAFCCVISRLDLLEPKGVTDFHAQERPDVLVLQEGPQGTRSMRLVETDVDALLETTEL